MNVTPAILAKSHGVDRRTAWLWMSRVEKEHPGVVWRRGRELVADARKIQPYIPQPRRLLVGAEEHARTQEQVREFQRRLDVEARERLKLRDAVDGLLARVSALEAAR